MALSDNMKGAFLMVGGMCAFTTNDMLMKLVIETLPLPQSIALRGVFTSLIIAGLAIRLGLFRFRYSGRDWALLVLRTVAELASTYFFLSALTMMPLANATAIMQALPLTVALAAALVLQEPLGWRRMTAILVGFGGMLLIVRPGPDGFSQPALYALIAVLLVTVRDLTSRKLSPEVPSLSVAFIAAASITVYFAVGAMRADWVPMTSREILLLAGATASIFFGYVFSVMTMRVGDIGFIAPFRYTGLVWALFLGLVVFGDWPAILTLIGAAIVVATGLYTLYRERRLARAARA